jgi:hypothetical protein
VVDMALVVLFIIVFSLGLILGYVIRVFLTKHQYSGTINVTETPEKIVYSLELDYAPEELEKQKEATFRINIHPTMMSHDNHGL